jgi:hypothetical protein
MRKSTKILSVIVAGTLAAAGLSFAQLAGKGTEVKAQAPAPCVCSRTVAIVGAEEPTTVAGQAYPRFGITHCQCGPLACVSQVPFSIGAANQLVCVK